MVPTPFTWCYGGHQVSLSASFNGWSEIPMVLIEGSATVFQVVVDLPPGGYQYKFLVDGTWRVDEQQICEPDEHGIINNIVLVKGTEFIFPDLNAAPLQPSTSRDNEVMPSEGSSSGDTLGGQVTNFSNGDMEFFRQVLSMHLLSSTTYELIPKSGKVIGLYINMHVEEAFHVMFEQGIHVVPLLDEDIGQMVGMLTASDFVLILLQLQKNHTMSANVEHEIRTISSWKAWKLQHHRDIVRTMLPLQRRPLIHAGPDESLGDVASRIMQNNISAVPVIDLADGFCPRLLHVLCLAGILKSVCNHFKSHLAYLPLLQKPIVYLPIGTWAVQVRRTSGRPLLTVHLNDPLSFTLTLLLEAQVSSVPIVDDDGSIVNVYSMSDITSLAKDELYTRIQLNHMTVSQALDVSTAGAAGRNRYQTCTRLDPLYRVMELLSEPDTRRVIIVDVSSSRVEGIITLRDIFNFFSQ